MERGYKFTGVAIKSFTECNRVTLCPFYFCNHLNSEERAGCFA